MIYLPEENLMNLYKSVCLDTTTLMFLNCVQVNRFIHSYIFSDGGVWIFIFYIFSLIFEIFFFYFDA